MSLLDFFEMVELLRLCSFYPLRWLSLPSLWCPWVSLGWFRPDITIPVVLFMLIFLHKGKSTESDELKVVGFGQEFLTDPLLVYWHVGSLVVSFWLELSWGWSD